MNPATGDVYPLAVFDRENASSHTFVVTARDDSSPFFTTSVNVTVTIEDVNDNAPYFANSTEVPLYENATAGQVVGRFIFEDDDEGSNAMVSYSITGGSGADRFTITHDGDLTVASGASFDFETNTSFTVEIAATDGGSPPMNNSVTLNIMILNIDDNRPLFNPKLYEFTVSENSPNGTNVGQVVAMDSDPPIEFRYVFPPNTEQSILDTFSLNIITGNITTKRPIDREVDPSFKFTVSVSLAENLDNITDNATVIVTVRDVNDHPIEVTRFDSVNVTEGQSTGSIVGRIFARDNDTDSNLQYYLTSPSGVLSINLTTGVISIAQVIDRETLPGAVPCNPLIPGVSCYGITGIVRDVTSKQLVFSTASVLMVTDVDDEPPVLSSTMYTATISESTPVGTPVDGLGITATDPDLGVLFSYSLDSSVLDFSVALRTGLISVARQLDYEDKPRNYTFLLTVADTNGNTDNATVTIYITDFNDNAPIFNQTLYTASVEEDSSSGVFVAVVTATDRDSPPNAEITYNISAGNPDGIFAINPSNGIITVAGSVDREQQSSHTLIVTAVDSGNPQQSNTTTVEITVEDIGDRPPVFTATEFIGIVNETAQNGDPVLDSATRLPLFANASDADVNATVTIATIAVGSIPFTVNPNTGAVTVSGSLDHEAQAEYSFFVTATDEFGLISIPVKVTITVFDRDDNAPVFSSLVYNVSLDEDRSLGYLVTTVTAIDADNTAGAVVYMLEGQSPVPPFVINSANGQITVNGTLDYESGITSYQLKVLASSNNFMTRGNATVNIAIQDVNDEAPMFVVSMYAVSVEENEIRNFLLVNATDEDTNAVIRYQLLSGNTSFFEIDDMTGEIRTAEDLDYEEYQELNIVVLAFNPDNPDLNTTVPVEVTVIDVNDNSPVFTSSPFVATVPESSPKGYEIVNATATDADTAGNFGTITYSIQLSLPSNNAITIDGSTGTISVASNTLPSRQQISGYVLQVIARDGGSPARETSVLVLISVTDVNEQPEFSEESYTVEEAEDAVNGTVVLTVVASEAGDTGNNSIITYSIILPEGYIQDPVYTCMNVTTVIPVVVNATAAPVVSGSGSESSGIEGMLSGSGSEDEPSTPAPIIVVTEVCTLVAPLFPFRINSSSGDIFIQAPLDYETNTSWVFSVVATDDGTMRLSDTATVTVTVTDVNDNAPKFTEDEFYVFVNETFPVGGVVTDVVKATDADSVSEGDLRYYIISGGEGKFTMNQVTGQVTLAAPLEVRTYMVRVQVTDGEFPVDTNLIIRVVDQNNNGPVFLMDVFTGSFPEEEDAGYSIMRIVAMDDDTENGQGDVFFRLIGNTEFRINRTSGELFTESDEFDFETPPNQYNLTVEAYDGGVPPRTATAIIVLSVTDINDNAPYFSEDEYEANLNEGEFTQEFVIDLTAMDDDSGVNEEVDYAIIPSNYSSQFNITNQGVINAMGAFDYDDPEEIPRVYELTITATDRGQPSMTGNTTVIVNIVDRNDNAPIFPTSSIRVLVRENSTVNQTVFVIRATDADSGVNGMIRYEINSTFPTSCDGTYQLDAASGNLSLAKSVDVENAQADLECSLFVRATDQGSPQRYSDLTILARLTDVNEFPPMFVGPVETSVQENSPAGTIFFTFRTTDKDLNNVMYEIVDGDDDLFSVNATSGELSVAEGAMLDYEKEKSYSIVVEAKDDGIPQMSSQSSLSIEITDANDLPPVFEQAAYRISLRENTPVGSTILITRATDNDTAPNAQISYMFVTNLENETDYGKFAVNSSTGDVTISTSLDYETEQRLYYMVVQASDGVNTRTARVNIRVLESNDNRPVFINLPNTTSIAEDADNDTFIFQAFATDADILVNGKVVYSLAPEENPKFRIEPETGVIRVMGDGQFDFDSDMKEFTIVVIASDSAGDEPSGDNQPIEVSGFGPDPLINLNDSVLLTSQLLVIAITDVNDNAPQFLQDKYTAAVEEHEANNIVLLQVTARDDDEMNTNRSTVRYTIDSGDFGRFSINEVTGVITTIPPIDRETNPFFELIVVAYDLGVPRLNSSVLVNVTIIDADDEAPRFVRNIYTAELVENAPQGTFVVQVVANDIDQNTVGTVNYTLFDPSGHFTINSSGIITTTALPVDREATAHFTLTVRATDGQGLSDTTTVIITVMDVNDNAPKFQQATYLFNISENTPISSLIMGPSIAILAEDGDTSSFNITKYILTQTSGQAQSGRFSIDPVTGAVQVVTSLCFSAVSLQTYTFTVTAYDDDLPALNSTAQLTIIVHEENNFSPLFTRPSYVGRLNELAKAGTVVIPSLETTDQDICSGDPVFRIKSGNVNNTFQIDSSSGQITLARNLTSSDLSFTLTLTATDTENNKVQDRTGEVRLIVLIGQLLPVAITAEGAHTVPTISRETQTVYQQELWVHNGGVLSSPPSVFYTLGSTEVNRTLEVEAAEANSVSAILVTESIYTDRDRVMVALQVSGENYEQAYVRETEVHVTVMPPTGVNPLASAITGTCTTEEPGTGSYCLARVPVPASWFSAPISSADGSGSGLEQPSSPTVAVYYGLSDEQDEQEKIGDVSLIGKASCSNASTINRVRVSVPLQVNYPGETFEVSVAANADYDITNFQFNCESEEGVTFGKVTSMNGYVVAAEANGSRVHVSGINPSPHNQKVTVLEELVTMEVILSESIDVTEEKYLDFSCFVDHVVNARVEEPISRTPASHISLGESSCQATTAGILVAPREMRGMFAYASSSSILNTAKLNGQTVSVNVTAIGVYINGQFQTETDLECNTSAPLKMTNDCQQVYQDGSETAGSNHTSISITGEGNASATLFFRVWYPVESTIITESEELRPIQGSLDSNCNQLYERSNVEVEVVFRAGQTLTQTAVLTSLLQDNLFSSNTNVVELMKNGRLVKAIGRSAGTASLELRHSAGGIPVEDLVLTVSNTAISVQDLSFNLHTSLEPAKLEEATVGSQYNENAAVAIQTDLRYLNTPVVVVTDAVLSNGRNFELTREDNLRLISEDEEVIIVSMDDEVTVRGSGSGLLLRGNWSNSANCSGQPLYSTTELINVPLVNVSSIEASATASRLAVIQHASILSLPNSTLISASIVHIDGTRVPVTTDSRTIYQDSEDLLVFSQGVARPSSKADPVMTSTGYTSNLNSTSTNITVRYLSSQINTSTIIGPIEVVSIVDIKLSTYPYPGWNGAESIDTLRRYAGTSSYQKAQLRLTATLSNGEEVDITDASAVQYSTENNGTEAEVNGSVLTVKTDAVVNITADVAGFSSETSIEVLNEEVRITSISVFELSFEGTFSGVRQSKAAVETVGLLFSDQSRIPNLIGESGPIFEGLVHFNSTAGNIIDIHSSNGEMTLLRNSHSQVQLSVTASANTTVTTQQLVFANLVPVLGDADFGAESNSPLPATITAGSAIMLPIYVNTNGTMVGAVEIRVTYSDAILRLTQRPQAPSDLSYALFESTYDDTAGETRFGIIYQNGREGETRMEVGRLSFMVKTIGTGFIAVDVITLNTYSSTISDIGADTPRRTYPAQIVFRVVGANLGNVQLPPAPPAPTRCNSSRCSPEQCVAISGESSGADANGDCVFDLLDALATLQQSAIGNSSSLSPTQAKAMDADKNGRISSLDAQMLMKANFDNFPFISDIIVRPIDAKFSNCVLTINMTLGRKTGAVQNNTYIIFGLFDTSRDFQEQYDATTLAVGNKRTGLTLPMDASGGWIEPEYLENGTYGIRTNPGPIAQLDMGFIAVYGDTRGISARSLTVIGKPTPPVDFAKLEAMIDVSGSDITVSLLDGFNAQTSFNNSFNATVCYNNYPPVTVLAGPYTNTRAENVAINNTIVVVTASDQDAPLPSGQLRYSLEDLTEPGTLDIDPVTGRLFVASSLDYENYDEIRVDVVVTDQGPHISTRMSATLEVRLTVTDVNDNPPVPAQSLYAFNVSEETTLPSGSLLTIIVSDNDTSPQFRNFAFEITGGDSPSPKFSINNNGELSLG